MATTISPKHKARKKSVLQRIRQTERRAAINSANRSRVRTQVKRFRAAVAGGNLAEAQQLLRTTLSVIDRSVQKGVVHANAAARTKSRLMVRFNQLAAKPAAGAAR